jgi:phosphonate transport system substrate-binding protein
MTSPRSCPRPAFLLLACRRLRRADPAGVPHHRHPGRIADRAGRKAAPLASTSERKLGTKVEFTPVTDYAAAVRALVNKQGRPGWFGGFTFVQAQQRSGGKVIPLVQREEDEKFRSVFITTDPAIKRWPT